MKIKMLVSISGAGFALSRGDETERFPENDALNLIKSGAAMVVDGVGYEGAVMGSQATETAVAALNIHAAGLDGQGGQEPAGSGEAGASEPEISTANAGSGDDAGTTDQTSAAQVVPAKAKGKAD